LDYRTQPSCLSSFNHTPSKLLAPPTQTPPPVYCTYRYYTGMKRIALNDTPPVLASFYHLFAITVIPQGDHTAILLVDYDALQVKRASAVLILANRCATNEDEEDAANIMRATAVKNFKEDTRIIIQLLQYRNKVADTRASLSPRPLSAAAIFH